MQKSIAPSLLSVSEHKYGVPVRRLRVTLSTQMDRKDVKTSVLGVLTKSQQDPLTFKEIKARIGEVRLAWRSHVAKTIIGFAHQAVSQPMLKEILEQTCEKAKESGGRVTYLLKPEYRDNTA